MKKFIVLLLTGFLFYSCSAVSENRLTQVSTIDALLAGYYDGVMPLNKLKEFGDFGIGTFNKLDGEMIVLDGNIYQFKADGKIYKAEPDNTTPFASVLNFTAGSSFPISGSTNYNSLQAIIDSTIKNKNLFYAIKVTGNFSYVKTRSVPAQEKPYKPLNEVTKTQPVFEKHEQTGTLIGFRLPAFTSCINVPGYHLHFLSSDFSFGGHLLDFTAGNIKVEIQEINNFYMVLPQGDSSFGDLDLSKDRTKELHEAEK